MAKVVGMLKFVWDGRRFDNNPQSVRYEITQTVSRPLYMVPKQPRPGGFAAPYSKKRSSAAALPERPKPIKSGQIIRILSVEKAMAAVRLCISKTAKKANTPDHTFVSTCSEASDDVAIKI